MSNKYNTENVRVEQLIPQQLVGDAQALIEFLKEYYRFLNESNNPSQVINNLLDNKDLDEAVDSFVDMIAKEIGYGMAKDLATNKINLYKHIREFYQAKGSIDSFKLLFRLLFNKEVEISLPKEQILVASDGNWIQQISLFADISSGNAFDLVNTFVDIVNPDGSIIRVEVERVKKVSNSYSGPSIYELVISRFFVGTINTQATFTNSNASGVIANSLSGFNIDYPGKKFKIGQLLDVVYGQSIGTKVKVTSVDTNGGITGLEFLSFGTNYPNTFTSHLIPFGYDYSFSSTTNTDGSVDYEGSLNDSANIIEYMYLEINPYCYGASEPQYDLTDIYAYGDDELQESSDVYAESYFADIYGEGLEFVRINNNQYFDDVYSAGVTEVRINSDKYFAEAYLEGQRAVGTLEAVTQDTSGIKQLDLTDLDLSDLETIQALYPNRAIISFSNTPISKYSGSYSTNKGFLSDDIYLQDNYYYQQFSYVIKTDEQYSVYNNLVKQTVHPSGMLMFGQFEITNEIDASIAMELLQRLYRGNYLDVVRSDEEDSKHITKPQEDEIITSQFVYYELTKPFEEEQFATDVYISEFGKNVDETIISTEQILSRDITKALSHEAEAQDGNIVEDPLTVYATDYFRQDYSEGLTIDSSSGFNYILTKGFGGLSETIYSADGDNPYSSYSIDYFAQTYSEGTGPEAELEFTKVLSDQVAIIQNINKSLEKPFAEIVNTNEESTLLTTKPFTETTPTEDRFYTDPLDNTIYVESPNDPDSDVGGDGYFADYYVENINIPLFDKDFTKVLTDSINNSEGGAVEINPYAIYYFADDYDSATIRRAIS